jgi:hypothetical protein
MSYKALDKEFDSLMARGASSEELKQKMAMAYAKHMDDFVPVPVPVGTPPTIIMPATAVALRKTLTPPLFAKFPVQILWCKTLLDIWTNQFVMGGFIAAVPGAFSPGPMYSTVLTGLQAVTVKLGTDFSDPTKKYSSWAREHENVILKSIGFVQFSGTIPTPPPGVPCVCNIGMKYEGDDDEQDSESE